MTGLDELDKWVTLHVGAKYIDYVELRQKIREFRKSECEIEPKPWVTAYQEGVLTGIQYGREKVLNDLRNTLTHRRVYHVHDDELRGLEFYVKLSDIYKEIDDLLRKQGEQE